MEKLYYYVAQTYINSEGASVSIFAGSEGAYGLHTTTNFNDENICYFERVEDAKGLAYGVGNTDRTVHSCFLDAEPINLARRSTT